VNGQQPTGPASLVVPNTAQIEGPILGLPIGSKIYLAARQPGGKWHLQTAPAVIERWGLWHSLGTQLLPSSVPFRRPCQVVAVVLQRPPQVSEIDDAELQRIAQKISEPVNVEIERWIEPTNAVPFEITAIQGQPVVSGTIPVVPLSIDLRGTTEPLSPGLKIRVAVRDRQGLVSVLESPAVVRDREWSISNLQLPLWTLRQRGARQLIMVRSAADPPTDPQSPAAITKWSDATSAPVDIVVNPVFLTLDRMIDTQGNQFLLGEAQDSVTEIPGLSPTEQIEVLSDYPGNDIAIFLLLRPEGSDRWLAFGPARFLTARHWAIYGVKLNSSGPSRWRYCAIQAIVSSEPLSGRAFTDEQLNSVNLGSSNSRAIRFAMSDVEQTRKNGAASIQMTADTGRPLDTDGAAFPLSVGSGIRGTANLPPDTSLSAGIRCPGSQFWHFQPISVSHAGGFRVSSLSYIECPAKDANVVAEFLLVASDLSLAGAVDDAFRTPYTVTDSGTPLLVTLPHRSWLSRVLSGSMPWQLSNSSTDALQSSQEVTSKGSINMSQWGYGALVFLVLMLLGVTTRLFGTRVWVWFNAVLDAKRKCPNPNATVLSPFETQIVARCNRRILRRCGRRVARVALLTRLSEISEPTLSRAAHLTLLSLFFLSETVFNLMAFNVFREPMTTTLVMALSVGVGVPVCAIAVGIWACKFNTHRLLNATRIGMLILAVAAGLYAVNLSRVAYLTHHSPEYLRQNPHLSTALFVLTMFIFVATTVVTVLAQETDRPATTGGNHVFERRRAHIDRETFLVRTWADEEKAASMQLVGTYRTTIMRRNKEVPKYFYDGDEPPYTPEFIDIEALLAHGEAALPPSDSIISTEVPPQGKGSSPRARRSSVRLPVHDLEKDPGFVAVQPEVPTNGKPNGAGRA